MKREAMTWKSERKLKKGMEKYYCDRTKEDWESKGNEIERLRKRWENEGKRIGIIFVCVTVVYLVFLSGWNLTVWFDCFSFRLLSDVRQEHKYLVPPFSWKMPQEN